MKLTKQDVELLKNAFIACKTTGIESVVITEGMIRGASPDRNTAIISEIGLSIDPTLKIGISKLSDLEKRLALFGTLDVAIEGTEKENKDVAILNMQAGRTKAQLRCTAERLIRYPKANNDTQAVSVFFSKEEAQHVAKAVKTFGAEHVTIMVTTSGTVKIECKDASNDVFSLDLETQAEFVEDASITIFNYFASNFTAVLDAVAKTDEIVVVNIGEGGSLQIPVRSHTLIIIPVDEGDE